jgi:hypothetical protein
MNQAGQIPCADPGMEMAEVSMAKRAHSGRNVGSGVVVGGGTLALGAWSPVACALVLGVVLVLALTVSVVVLTAAWSSDRRKQRNSAAVLDSLLRVLRKSPSDS